MAYGTNGGVAEALGALLAHLERLGRREVLGRLRPGMTAAATTSALSAAGLEAPAPLVDWFTRADGVNTDGALIGDLYLLPGFYPLPLEGALEHRHYAMGWPRAWLPILANGGGDYFVVDTTDNEAPVLEFLVYDQPAVAVATGLEAFLRLVLQAFEDGVVFVDAEGHLEQNDEQWRRMLDST